MSAAFTLGGEQHEHVRVVVLGRAYPSDDYWDGNWLTAEVEVAVGPWRGAYRANLRAEEFRSFGDQIERLYNDANGSPAVFESLEPWLKVTVTRSDRLGHIEVRGTARQLDQTASIQFALALDQSYLPATLAGLAEITKAFPVFGSPGDTDKKRSPRG